MTGGTKYEGCGEIGSIRAIFLAQFHPDQGPLIRCQWPHHFLSKEHFDSLSRFIIPKNEIQAQTITVNCMEYKGSTKTWMAINTHASLNRALKLFDPSDHQCKSVARYPATPHISGTKNTEGTTCCSIFALSATRGPELSSSNLLSGNLANSSAISRSRAAFCPAVLRTMGRRWGMRYRACWCR